MSSKSCYKNNAYLKKSPLITSLREKKIYQHNNGSISSHTRSFSGKKKTAGIVIDHQILFPYSFQTTADAKEEEEEEDWKCWGP